MLKALDKLKRPFIYSRTYCALRVALSQSNSCYYWDELNYWNTLCYTLAFKERPFSTCNTWSILTYLRVILSEIIGKWNFREKLLLNENIFKVKFLFAFYLLNLHFFWERERQREITRTTFWNQSEISFSPYFPNFCHRLAFINRVVWLIADFKGKQEICHFV